MSMVHSAPGSAGRQSRSGTGRASSASRRARSRDSPAGEEPLGGRQRPRAIDRAGQGARHPGRVDEHGRGRRPAARQAGIHRRGERSKQDAQEPRPEPGLVAGGDERDRIGCRAEPGPDPGQRAAKGLAIADDAEVRAGIGRHVRSRSSRGDHHHHDATPGTGERTDRPP